jgi:hypothetical protein
MNKQRAQIQRPPELLKGVVFDHAFFDSAIMRAGGKRLADVVAIPTDTANADYLIDNFVVELKTLMTDPLDANERQADITNFLEQEIPYHRRIWVSDNRQAVVFDKEQSTAYWERLIGKSMRDRLRRAAKQIRKTRTFAPNASKGAVLLVNSAGTTFDYSGFMLLAGLYVKSLPEIDAIFALNGVPVSMNGSHMIHFGIISKDDSQAEADPLGMRLQQAIREEIAHRRKEPIEKIEMGEIGTKIEMPGATFSSTRDGVRRVR